MSSIQQALTSHFNVTFCGHDLDENFPTGHETILQSLAQLVALELIVKIIDMNIKHQEH